LHTIKSITALVVVLLLISSAVYYKINQTQALNRGNQSVPTLKIAYLPITHSLLLFKTKEELEKQGNVKIELIKYGGWSELMDALNTDNVDGAAVLIELAMRSKEQGLPLELDTLGHRDGNVIITSNAITTPDQLRGKTFAIPNIQSSHNILLLQFLKNNGLTSSIEYN
jgi:NitT/TauT family transport system substrate-binding protein